MLVKSILISTAAALLGPIIGVAVFFMADSDRGAQATSPTVSTRVGPVTELGEAEVIRSFAPQGVDLRFASILVPERKPQGSAARTAESAAWRTVVTCAVGEPAEDGRCPVPKNFPATATREALADITPPTDAPTSSLSGRMSVGAR